MEIINDGVLHQAPGCCFICECKDPGVRFVDTKRDYSEPYARLDGRKYVCETCVTDLAKAFGMPKNWLAPAQARINELEGQVMALEIERDDAQGSQVRVVPVDDVIEALKVSRAPARKAPAKEA